MRNMFEHSSGPTVYRNYLNVCVRIDTPEKIAMSRAAKPKEAQTRVRSVHHSIN